MPAPPFNRRALSAIGVSLRGKHVAYWKLEESSGNRLDSTPNALDLTPNSTPGNAAGIQGNALSLVVASSQWLKRLNASLGGLAQGANDFAITCFVQPASIGIDQAICSVYTSTTNQRAYRLRITTANQWEFVISTNGTGSVTVTNSTITPVAGAWYFVRVTKIGSAVYLAINEGVPAQAALGFSTVFASTADFLVGAYNSSGGRWGGLIDELAFWKPGLTADEGRYLYNGGAGRTYPFS